MWAYADHIYSEDDERIQMKDIETFIAHQPRPKGFPPIVRRGLIISTCLDLRQTSIEIHLCRFDGGDTRPKLRSDIQYWEQYERKIVCDKGGAVPFMAKKYRPATELQETDFQMSRKKYKVPGHVPDK